MFNCPLKGKCRLIQRHGVNPALYSQFGLDGHDGLDIASMKPGKKERVFAPVDGRIVISGKYGAYGNCIRIIADSNPLDDKSEFTLAHFDSIDPLVRTGERVRLGQYLGMSGKTGHALGVHVHLQLRILNHLGTVLNYNNGFKGSVDPLPFMLMWEHSNESPLLIRA